MSDDSKSAMLSEGDASVRRGNESLESVPAASSGEGDVSGAADRTDRDGASTGPATDTDIEHVSRTATSPSIEAEPEDDPQGPGQAPDKA